ncbi:MAG: dihydroxyacetone kinase subunit DhaK [Sphaerochaetaceae bacterium]|nr:dihydroxyacetone kinase subunit DhaK [Sphaerochaetaceae bacterium]
MKKILNNPKEFVKDTLNGIYSAHPQDLTFVNNDIHCLVKRNLIDNKVGIVTGGGSGHLPLFLGYVGDGLLDGCAIGDVFQSPSSEQILEITKEVDKGKGVLYIYGNYTGDIMNFEMASELADFDDIKTAHFVVGDDVASSKKGEEHKRRGVAGIFFVYKCAGAKANKFASLDEVKRIAKKTAESTRTMGFALSPCIIPEVGEPSFTIEPNEMEIGMGIHGEPGINRTQIMSAKELASTLLNKIFDDYSYKKDDEVCVLVNGLGATPKEELYILFNEIHQYLKKRGIKIFNTYVGEFATSMEMAGGSISILKLDDELKELMRQPCYTPFFTQKEL